MMLKSQKQRMKKVLVYFYFMEKMFNCGEQQLLALALLRFSIMDGFQKALLRIVTLIEVVLKVIQCFLYQFTGKTLRNEKVQKLAQVFKVISQFLIHYLRIMFSIFQFLISNSRIQLNLFIVGSTSILPFNIPILKEIMATDKMGVLLMQVQLFFKNHQTKKQRY